MKYNYLTRLAAVAALFVAFSAQAHDPKEHMKDAQNPDCAAMANMDHGHMKKDDPVMQAMMQKCMKEMHDMHDMHHGEGHGMMSESGKMSGSNEAHKPNKADEHAGHH